MYSRSAGKYNVDVNAQNSAPPRANSKSSQPTKKDYSAEYSNSSLLKAAWEKKSTAERPTPPGKPPKKRSSILGRRASQLSCFFNEVFGQSRRASLMKKNDDLSMEVSFFVLDFSKKNGVPVNEVRAVAKHYQVSVQETTAENGLDIDTFYIFLGKVFDVEHVERDFFLRAWKSFTVHHPCTLENFLDWYKLNMFNDVAVRLCDAQSKESEAMIYLQAKKHKVNPLFVDHIKTLFDKLDLDKSGRLEYDEFEELMLKVLKASKDDVSQERLKNFWKEIEENGDGSVDFDEFTCWYLKYFKGGPGRSSTGPVEQFYESYLPLTTRLAQKCEPKGRRWSLFGKK
eukprot:TRINITY_DN3510_c0_g2_i2.p1 TRINITY_DN3510_c0_g2~~TRINITY_DN3510_c0_g2_i2.p1  ORF type:complete len:383 (-),score=84.12 TRINITY_DN3510_c0_g2_i2:185-1210(-)